MVHYQRNLQIAQLILLPIVAFFLGWVLHGKYSGTQQQAAVVNHEMEAETEEKGLKDRIRIPIRKKTQPKDVDLSSLWETWNTLEANFLNQEKFKTKEQIHGIIKGLVDSLDDPYTIYMTPDENREFEESIAGEFEGIGAEIAVKNDQLTIVTPLKGSPAEQAGLMPGDIIYKVDGEPTLGFSAFEAAMKIRGPKGEKVELEIVRKDEPKPLEITIVRDKITIKSLEWEMKDGIAYIEIAQFGTEVLREFRESVPDILLENPAGIIIDLRNNGGGLLDATVEIADEFFDNKIIVKTKGRKLANSEEFTSDEGGSFINVPLGVLINRGSASASEIFAGAVSDNDRGVIVGEKSFGKGSVQNVIPLSDGGSLKVTIAEWITPAGNSIHDAGIVPDEEVVRTKEDYENEDDPALDRILEILRDESEYQTLLDQNNHNTEEVAEAEKPEPVSSDTSTEEAEASEEVSADNTEEDNSEETIN